MTEHQYLVAAPEIALRLIELLQHERTAVREVVPLIARDQAVTASLLRLVNSALLGGAERVTSIAQAMNLLGFDRVRDIALNLSLWGKWEKLGHNAAAFRRSLWTHSAAVGAASRAIAQVVGGDESAAYAAGLLHDVGELVLALHFGEPYCELAEDASHHDLPTLEDQQFACNHSEAGAYLLDRWGLPVAFVAAAALHHAESAAAKDAQLSGIVALADRVISASAHGVGEGTGMPAAPTCLARERWPQVLERIADEQKAIERFFAGAHAGPRTSGWGGALDR
jgi:putative nucleotidyltransferase with HDIG domain